MPSPDPDKTFFYSKWDSFKELISGVGRPVEQIVVPAGTVVPSGGVVVASFLYTIPLAQGVMGEVMLNFVGDANIAARWYPARSAPRLGLSTISGGVGAQAFEIRTSYNQGQYFVSVAARNPSGVSQTLVNAVTISAKGTFFVAPFA